MSGTDEARTPSRIDDLYSAPPAKRERPLGDILSSQEALFDALGARRGLFSTFEPKNVPARDLLLRELAEMTGEAGDEVIAAVADEQNAAARMLNKLLVNIGAPKCTHRGKIGRPSTAINYFAALTLGSALKAQGHSQKEFQKRLKKALDRLGIEYMTAEAAVDAYKEARRRFVPR